MKPDWKDAPDWAEWLAMDACGEWWWTACKPEIKEDCWVDKSGQASRFTQPGWQDTLEERPK